jgi:polyisoprenyl-teichoic acid--peptidoglycan teichoic acid transferase
MTQISEKRKRKDRLTLGLMIGFAVLSIVLAVTAFILVRNFVLTWDITELPGVPVDVGGDTTTGGPEDPDGLPDAAGIVDPIEAPEFTPIESWDGGSRVNILVMGLDFRDWEAGETPRTDSMILVTVDPISKTAGMLSVPRDLWVNIPGYDYGKINTAYYLGEVYQVPGGGPALAAETIEHFLGVPVHYFAQIDFVAFIKFIDEIGGLKITVEEPIVIYPIEFPSLDGSTKVLLEPGRYRLSGSYILAYARARNTEGGDFDRAFRQQQVIIAVRDEIVDFNHLPDLIAKAPKIYGDLSTGVRTNLNLQQIIQLSGLAMQIDPAEIRRGVITPDVVTTGFSPDGLHILIPIIDEIRLIRDEIFTTGGPVGPAALGNDLMLLVQQEQARVSVQNGTQSAGLANSTAQYLKSQGLNVVEETNADQVYDITTIIINNGVPYTINYLSRIMNVSTSHIFNRYDPNSHADVVIMVGNDWNNNNPMP